MGLNLSRNRGTYDGSAFFRDETKIAEKKIPLNSLVSWEGQPFEPYTDEALESLAASIAENGLLSPIIVTADGDKYRIIAGHNRARACEKLGWTEIDAIVKDTDEDHAQLMMLDTNLCQRHSLSVVELIKAYKMQFDVLNRIMGKKKGLKTLMAEQYGVTRKTIERYIKCANLEECLLTLLNDGRLPKSPDSSTKMLKILITNSKCKKNDGEMSPSAVTQIKRPSQKIRHTAPLLYSIIAEKITVVKRLFRKISQMQ